MAILRSVVFFNDSVLSTALIDLYTVPAGHRIGLRGITARNLSGSNNQFKLGYKRAGVDHAFWTSVVLGSVATQTDVLYAVFEPGDILRGQCNLVAGCNVNLSGSLYFI